MAVLQWIDHQISKIEKTFLAASILFTSLLLFVNVIMRYVFLHAIYWAEELVRYMMVWVIFVGGSQVAIGGGHVAVDILPRMLSKRANRALGFFVTVVAILFTIVLLYYSWQQVMRVRAAQQVSPALELPMWIVYLSIPVGSMLMFVRFVQQFLLMLKGVTRKAEEILD